MSHEMVELDGAHLEGGGQIVRTAVGFAAVTGRPCRVFNIRKGRSNPGLRPQHLKGVEAVARLCGAALEGAKIESSELVFRPGELSPEPELSVDVGTAGAVTLVLQAMMIPLACATRPVRLRVRGGTHVAWAPTADYFEHVFAWHLARMGCEMRIKRGRCGFFPKGGGEVAVDVAPGALHAVDWTEPGSLRRVELWSIATTDLRRAEVAERQVDGAARVLDIRDVRVEYVDASSTGTAAFALARFDNAVLGASALGERGVRAEKVGRTCAVRLREQMESAACIDEHMADQALPFMALAEGDSRVRVADVTTHCRTNMWVIEQFLPVRFEVDEEQVVIACRHGQG